jgi:hydrogenase-4 component E
MLENLELLCCALLLLSAFMLLLERRMLNMIYIFAWQSAILALASCLEAISYHEIELFFSVLLIILLKVIFIPWFLLRLLKKLAAGGASYHPTALVNRPFLLSIIAAGIVLFSYHLILPIRKLSLLVNSNVLAVALAVVLLGMLLIITHRKAISHAIGFMVMENGIFFGALIATNGMPMLMELGIAFDVLVAIILFGVSFFHISSSIDSLDVDQLNKLREG